MRRAQRAQRDGWQRSVGAVACALFLAVVLPDVGVAQDGELVLSLLSAEERIAVPGPSLFGTLTPDDYLSDSGKRVQAWSLDGLSGDALRIRLTSSDFDPYLFVIGPGGGAGWTDDDSGSGLNSLLCLVFPTDGEYRLVAGSLAGGMGTYTLDVVEEDPAQVESCTPAGEVVGPNVGSLEELDAGGRTLQMRATSSSQFTSTSPQYIGSPVEAWTFNGDAGQALSVDLTADFDAYLYLLGPGLTEWLADDDGAGCLNSRITLVLPESGAYTVVASALGAGTGPYELHISDSPGEQRGCSAGLPTLDPGPPAGDLSVEGSIEVSEERAGGLAVGDQEFQGRRTKVWTLEGTEGARIRIDHSSTAFDPYLYFSGPGFDIPLYNDDGGGALNSRICVELPENGTYRILASALTAEAVGDFVLSVQRFSGTPTECTFVEVSDARANQALIDLPAEGRTVRMGDSLGATLTSEDSVSPFDRQPIQAWDLDALLGWETSVELRSSEFDAYLKLLGPGLVPPLVNDDGAGGCDSRITFVPQAEGPYRIIVGSLLGGVGDFTLSVTDVPRPVIAQECAPLLGTTVSSRVVDASVLDGVEVGSRELPVGFEMEGRLTDGDPMLGNGIEGQAWGLSLQGGDVVIVELISEEFDANLYVSGPGMEGALFDDDGAASPLDSRIEIRARVAGTYRVVVSTLTAGENGAFRLRAFRLPGG